MVRGDHDGAAKTLDELERMVGPDHGGLLQLRGLLAWDLEGPEAARPLLERARTASPADADVHHALALLAEETGERAAMIEGFLKVRELDEAADQAAGRGKPREIDFIEREAEAALSRLPDDLRAPLENVPIILEDRPSRDLVAEGFDPRSLGLFDGIEQAGEADPEAPLRAPTRIVLYTMNLLAAFPDRAVLAEQIETTLFHEIGHYFGLDEDGVAALGLE